MAIPNSSATLLLDSTMSSKLLSRALVSRFLMAHQHN